MFNLIREYNYKINCTTQIITIKANVMSFLSNNLYRRIITLLLFTILLITKKTYIIKIIMIRALPYRMGYSVHREHAQHQGRTITLAHEVRGLDKSGSLLHTIFFSPDRLGFTVFVATFSTNAAVTPTSTAKWNRLFSFDIQPGQIRTAQTEPEPARTDKACNIFQHTEMTPAFLGLREHSGVPGFTHAVCISMYRSRPSHTWRFAIQCTWQCSAARLLLCAGVEDFYPSVICQILNPTNHPTKGWIDMGSLSWKSASKKR